MHLPNDFTVKILAPNEPLVGSFTGQLKPVELYVLPTGAKDDTPSYAWVLEGSNGQKFVAQISHSMLMEGVMRSQMILDEGGLYGSVK